MRRENKRLLQDRLLYLAWVIALAGFCISIFYGEILGHPPCSLCWYQRMALFPLVILLGIAAYLGETVIIPYVLPLAILGVLAALVHVLMPYVSFLQNIHICSAAAPCSHLGFSLWGVNGFALLSAIGFFLIALLLLIVKRQGV